MLRFANRKEGIAGQRADGHIKEEMDDLLMASCELLVTRLRSPRLILRGALKIMSQMADDIVQGIFKTVRSASR
jgi:hypothetical protein